MNKDEIKAVILPAIITIILFAFAFMGWLNSDMYWQEKKSLESQTREILNRTYYWGIFTPEEHEEWMEKHNLTDEDINGQRLFEQFTEGQKHEAD